MMVYKIETKLKGSEVWHRVIDTNLSKTKAVTKIFFNNVQAEDFAKKQLNLSAGEEYRIVETEDA